MDLIGHRSFDGLYFAGGPANHSFLNMRRLAKSEMQMTLILSGKPAAAHYLLPLLLPVPEATKAISG